MKLVPHQYPPAIFYCEPYLVILSPWVVEWLRYVITRLSSGRSKGVTGRHAARYPGQSLINSRYPLRGLSSTQAYRRVSIIAAALQRVSSASLTSPTMAVFRLVPRGPPDSDWLPVSPAGIAPGRASHTAAESRPARSGSWSNPRHRPRSSGCSALSPWTSTTNSPTSIPPATGRYASQPSASNH